MIDVEILSLGHLVNRTFTAMVRYLNYELKNRGINFQHPHFTILMILSRQEGVTQAEMADAVQRDKASVSRNLKHLEESGYVVRKSDGGRKNLIFLSEKGKELIPELYEIAKKNTENTLKGFPESKRKSIYNNLTKMCENASSFTYLIDSK